MPARLDTVPTTTHLTADQVERLRRRLIGEDTERQARAVELGDSVDLEPDLADVLLARNADAMDEIKAALRRIDDGTYGLCISCGKPVPFERLEIVPAAGRCVSCAARDPR